VCAHSLENQVEGAEEHLALQGNLKVRICCVVISR